MKICNELLREQGITVYRPCETCGSGPCERREDLPSAHLAKTDNGGPAYPGIIGPPKEYAQGMSLRDFFASQALAIIPGRSWAHLGSDEKIISSWAQTAYLVADAMLKAREA